jgi:hypothetical protein
VTVDVKKGFTSEGLADVLEHLYTYWVPGREPPVLEAPAEEEASAPAAGGDAPAVSAAASRVPAHLLERSRLAREKAAAKAG